METVMQIVGWDVHGLRCPDHRLNFEEGSGATHRITLIQMPNGTGKTTTLELLRAALSGAAEGDAWGPERVRSLRKQGGGDAGRFTLHIRLNDRRLTVVMDFDFVEGTVRYSTTYGSGNERGFKPPNEVRRFLHPDLVSFMVFDGELAGKLLSRDHTNAQRVIEDLFQLGDFTRVGNAVKAYWERQTARRGATEAKGLTQRRNKAAFWAERIAVLKEAQGERKRERERIGRDLEEKQARFKAALSEQKELQGRLNEAEKHFAEARGEVAMQAKGVLARMRSPHSLSVVFAGEMVSLKASLDRVKLPESAAREFFEELAEESVCVCGRPLNDETRQAVRDRAGRYLGSDDVSLLNTLKGDIADLIGASISTPEKELDAELEALRQATRERAELQTERDRVQNEGILNDPGLEQAQRDISELERQVDDLDEELARFEDPDDIGRDEDVRSIPVAKKRQDEAEERLAEITATLELKRKRDLLVEFLGLAHERARQSISKQICQDANQRIQNIMPNNAIFIDKIDRCLILKGQEGGSTGETLSVAYAFLASLFDRTGRRMPFMVDSPANPLDLRMRAKIGDLVPNLAQQFVAFTISSEREGFLTPLERAADRLDYTIQYYTIFRKGSSMLDTGVELTTDSEQSQDGWCVLGRDFFCGFDIDSEGDTDAV